MPTESRHAAALDRILELVVVLNADMTEDLARRGLSVARAGVVWTLLQRGSCTQRTLADALRVTARNITGLVDGLVADGFVTRAPHPTDRRATLVSFTARGAATARALQDGQTEFAAMLFDGMPAERFESLVAGLDDMLDRIRTQLDAGVPAGRAARVSAHRP